MSKRERYGYLKDWKQKKAEEDPEYFKEAARKAAAKRKQKLASEPELLEKEKERSREYAKKSRRRNPVKHMLSDAKKRARQKGIDFTLKESDLEIPEICPVLGIPLFRGEGKRSHNSPSLDRVNNGLGYIPSNVRVISLRANQLKNDATIDELKRIVQYMEDSLNALVCN